jgi:hypothetical protein
MTSLSPSNVLPFSGERRPVAFERTTAARRRAQPAVSRHKLPFERTTAVIIRCNGRFGGSPV